MLPYETNAGTECCGIRADEKNQITWNRLSGGKQHVSIGKTTDDYMPKKTGASHMSNRASA